MVTAVVVDDQSLMIVANPRSGGRHRSYSNEVRIVVVDVQRAARESQKVSRFIAPPRVVVTAVVVVGMASPRIDSWFPAEPEASNWFSASARSE